MGVYVDGDGLTTVDRERTAAGYARYGTTGGEFAEVVRAHAAGAVSNG
jgi:hypothetical protein